MPRLCRFYVVGFVLLGAPWPVAAQLIDDFEDGAFQLMTAGNSIAIQPVLQGIHCIDDERLVGLSSFAGNTTFAQLNLANPVPDHEVQSVFNVGGGLLSFQYYPLPTDITWGGLYDRLDVFVTVVDPWKFMVELRLEDTNGVSAAKSQFVPGTGPQAFFLSDFAGLDVTQITKIVVMFTTTSQGDLHVSDIRMHRRSASYMVADVVAPSASGPPYPTSPVQFLEGPRLAPPDPVMPIAALDITLERADNSSAMTPTPIALSLFGLDSGSGAGTFGNTAQVEVAWAGTGVPPVPGSFDIALNLLASGGFSLVRVSQLENHSAKTACVIFGYEFFDINGLPLGSSEHMAIFEVLDPNAVLASPRVVPPDPCNPPVRCDPIHVTFELEPLGGATERPASPSPLFTIKIVGDYGGRGAVLDAGRVGSLDTKIRLEATPTLMRTRTVLRLSNPHAGETDLSIHDVTGRLVQTLRLSAGGSAIWAGEDRWGRSAPAGVYLVKAPDVPGGPSLKLVKLR